MALTGYGLYDAAKKKAQDAEAKKRTFGNMITTVKDTATASNGAAAPTKTTTGSTGPATSMAQTSTRDRVRGLQTAISERNKAAVSNISNADLVAAGAAGGPDTGTAPFGNLTAEDALKAQDAYDKKYKELIDAGLSEDAAKDGATWERNRLIKEADSGNAAANAAANAPKERTGKDIAVDAYGTAVDEANAGMDFAVDQYGNLVNATTSYTDSLNKIIEDNKKKSDEFSANLSTYISGATGKLDADREKFAADAAARDARNADITKQLQASYDELQKMKPGTEEYEAFKAKLSVMEQNLVNDPYGKELENLYSGKKASAAELLLKKAQEEALNQQLSMTASARGGVNYAALARTASNNIVAQNQKAAQDAAILRAQEQERMLGMMISKQQSDRAQQMQMAQMGLQANQAQQAQNMQWASAINSATGQQANWANALAGMTASDANINMGFANAGNALMGLGIQGEGVVQGYSNMNLNATNAGFGAVSGTLGAGMNLGNSMASNALNVGNMGVNLGLGLEGVENNAARLALDARIARDNKKAARRGQDMALIGAALGGLSTLGAGFATKK